jgi:murein DD-endopeptidase MepM/ murein hydrolase activator NlpD
MRYSSIFRATLFLSVLSPLIAVGIDPTTSGRILDNFKKQEYEILFENMPFSQSGMNDIYEKEYILAGIEWLKARVADTTKVYESKKQEFKDKRLDLEGAIATIESAIEDTVSDIRDIERDMKSKNTLIDEYQDLSIGLSVRIKQNHTIILAYLANIYAESSLIYGEDHEIDILQSLILTESDTDTVSRDVAYKSLISILWQRFIDDYRALIKEYYRIQTRLREELALLEIDNEKLARERSNLITQRQYREQLLVTTKWREELYEKYIASQRALHEELETSWKDASRAYTLSLEKLLEENGCQKPKKTGKEIETCANILSFYRNEKALKKISIATGTTNVLTWPVDSKKWLSSFFKDPGYYRAVWSQHDAIDIRVDQSTDVEAALGGYVYYILPPVPGGYSYMALKHPGWYVTVYGASLRDTRETLSVRRARWSDSSEWMSSGYPGCMTYNDLTTPSLRGVPWSWPHRSSQSPRYIETRL